MSTLGVRIHIQRFSEYAAAPTLQSRGMISAANLDG
ncbi:hypothetical protein QO003_000882 [Arthrobacter silviterrae]|nr:hypothetical protein [Arthrobacter silviterrae]